MFRVKGIKGGVSKCQISNGIKCIEVTYYILRSLRVQSNLSSVISVEITQFHVDESNPSLRKVGK